METKTNYFHVMKFAGAFVAFMIGSGFASGMEILQFFVCYGFWGVFAALISLGLFMLSGAALMTRGFDTRRKPDIHPFDHWLIFRKKGRAPIFKGGKALSLFFEWLNPVFLFSMLIIMISGAGAAMHEYFGLPVKVGCFLMASAALVSVFCGLPRLIDIIGALGPFTILFTILIAIYALKENPLALGDAADALAQREVPSAAGAWWFAGILYAAYNIMPAVPFLTSMGAEAGTRREAALGAFLGSVMMMVSVVLLSLAQLSHISEIAEVKIPNLFLAGLLPDTFTLVFALVLLGEIYSSAAPMLWITCNQFIKDGKPGNKILAAALSAVAFFCGQIPFDRLVGTIYPLMGCIGTLLLVCIVVRQFVKA